MRNIPIKLNHPVEEFHYFEDNQVLTASHLNTVVDFMDRRDRMTRSKLLGSGIVCGLEVTFNGTQRTITVSKGTALTSDGDMIHLAEDMEYSHVRRFEDEDALYEPFRVEEIVVPLFQLFPRESDEENLISMRGNNNPIQNFGDMAVILYLNSFLQAPEDCTEVDCENHGMRQVNKLIPLLIAKSDLDRIENKPNNLYFNMPDPQIQRVNFHQNTITHEENLLARFRTAVETSSPSLINSVVASCGFREGDFLRNIITPIYQNPASRWRDTLNNIFNNININDRPDVLYIYNFMKDLAEAYGEFKEAVFDLWVECNPEPSWHPKHVMVQELIHENENIPSSYRHHFCEAPILNYRGRRVKKVQHLHQRINAMIDHFEVPNNQNAAIRITPSKKGDYNLGEKSIPYYYNASSFSLHRFWSYDKFIRNQSQSILSYRSAQYEGTNVALNPLNFSHDKLNFYRIEGHLGKTRVSVEAELERLKQVHNVHFNIVSVQIQDDARIVALPRFRFPAIDALFHHYREEFNSNIRTVNKFNTDLNSISTFSVTDKNTPQETMRESFENSRVQIATMQDDMQAARSQVRAPLSTFNQNYRTFKTNYQRAAVRGDSIHRNIFEYTQTKYETPMQKFVLDYKFNRFDGLIKYFRKKKEKVQQQYIFDKFFEQNPGLESLCGVPTGGTFVLVYAGAEDEADQRVVADFCLPSCCVVEIDPEVDPEEIPEEEIDTPDIQETLPDIKFIDRIDLFKFSPIKSIVDFNLVNAATTLDQKWTAILPANLGNINVGDNVTNPGGVVVNPGTTGTATLPGDLTRDDLVGGGVITGVGTPSDNIIIGTGGIPPVVGTGTVTIPETGEIILPPTTGTGTTTGTPTGTGTSTGTGTTSGTNIGSLVEGTTGVGLPGTIGTEVVIDTGRPTGGGTVTGTGIPIGTVIGGGRPTTGSVVVGGGRPTIGTGGLGVVRLSRPVGGLGVVGGTRPSLIIEDLALRNLIQNLDNTAFAISELEANGERSKEEDAKLKLLIKNFDANAESVLNMVDAKRGDIDITGDESKTMEIIQKAINNFEDKKGLVKLKKKAKDLERKNSRNPVKKGMARKISDKLDV